MNASAPNVKGFQLGLELERVFFTKCVAVALQEYSQHLAAGDVTIPVPDNNMKASPIEGQPGKYVATMSTAINVDKDPKMPYQIEMECLAIFKVDSSMDNDSAIRAVTITGHNVLYGAIREQVAWITGRQPYGQLLLGLSVLTGPENGAVAKSKSSTHK